MQDEQNLTIRSVKAVSWVLIFQFMNQFVQIAFGIIMVRLLSPTDYGILGVLAIFWAICKEFIQGGFGQALMQRKDISEIDLSSVFYYNILLGIVCGVAMFLAAPLIARIFQLQILVPIIRVTSWTLPIGALGSVQNVILSRSLKQGIANLIKFLSLVLSIPIGIWLAYKGSGVWALVWQTFFATLFGTVFAFLFVRWVPLLSFSFESLKNLFRFGFGIFINGILYSLITNIYNLAIGKFYSIEVLGYFEQARRYSSIWPTSIQGAIGTVLFPAFSKIQDDFPRLKNSFERALAISSFVVIFPTLLLCTLARPMIELILTVKWLPSIPIWWFLTLCFILYPVEELNVQVIKAVGDSKNFLMLKIISYVLIILNILITMRLCITWLLLGMVLTTVISCLLTAFCAGIKVGYSVYQQVVVFLTYLIVAFVSCFLAWVTNEILSERMPWFGFIAGILVGFVSFVMINILFKTRAVSELKSIIQRLRQGC